MQDFWQKDKCKMKHVFPFFGWPRQTDAYFQLTWPHLSASRQTLPEAQHIPYNIARGTTYSLGLIPSGSPDYSIADSRDLK